MTSSLRRSIRWPALPVLVLPVYVIASSLQACSSSAVSGGTTQAPLTCAANETPKKVGQHDVCCAQSAADFDCHAVGTPVTGGTCTTEGAKAALDAYRVTYDVCVVESCTGDRRCEEFPALAERRQGELTCKSGKWEAGTAVNVHRVERACLVSERIECATGQTYSTSGLGYYASSYFSGYPYSCGYGNNGAPTIAKRELFLLQSTCATTGAPAPCPVDDL
jgi:hypothetical protein